MKLIKNRLRYCEAFTAMYNEPHRIAMRLAIWQGAFIGCLRLRRRVDEFSTQEWLYFDRAPDFPVRLNASELLSEEWETYEV